MLALGPVWGECAACRPVQQDPVSPHDCCHPKSSSHHQPCPHDLRALHTFDTVEKQAVGGLDASTVVILPDVPAIPAPPTEPAEVAVVALSHAPPGLYLLNSSLLI
jgi:hypothetical protein